MKKILLLAFNYFKTASRSKIYLLLGLFAIIAVLSSNYFVRFSPHEEIKIIKDFCLGSIHLFGLVTVIFLSAAWFNSEIEKGTYYAILSRSVGTFVFLVGNYIGVQITLFFLILLASGSFGVLLAFKGLFIDLPLIQAIGLLFLKLAVISAIIFFLAILSSSFAFSATAGFVFYFAAHLKGYVGEWFMISPEKFFVSKLLFHAGYALVPHLTLFDITDNAILGLGVSTKYVLQMGLYSFMYIFVYILISWGVLHGKEV